MKLVLVLSCLAAVCFASQERSVRIMATSKKQDGYYMREMVEEVKEGDMIKLTKSISIIPSKEKEIPEKIPQKSVMKDAKEENSKQIAGLPGTQFPLNYLYRLLNAFTRAPSGEPRYRKPVRIIVINRAKPEDQVTSPTQQSAPQPEEDSWQVDNKKDNGFCNVSCVTPLPFETQIPAPPCVCHVN